MNDFAWLPGAITLFLGVLGIIGFFIARQRDAEKIGEQRERINTMDTSLKKVWEKVDGLALTNGHLDKAQEKNNMILEHLQQQMSIMQTQLNEIIRILSSGGRSNGN